MDYPRDFPPEAQATVEEEKILASSDFDERKATVKHNVYGSEQKLIVEIHLYIVRVVLAFAREACKLGRNGIWTAATVDSQVHQFMQQVAHEAQREKGFYKSGHKLDNLELIAWTPLAAISAPSMAFLKSLPDWKAYQKLLLEVTRAQQRQSKRSSEPGNSLGERLRQYREEANLTQKQLAKLVELTEKSVKRHESNKTDIRGPNRKAYERELSKALERSISL